MTSLTTSLHSSVGRGSGDVAMWVRRRRWHLRYVPAALMLHVACTSPDPSTPPASRAAATLTARSCRNVAIGATATAQSVFPGYSVNHVNDGDRDTTVGPDTSWSNAHTSAPDGHLPNWVMLDFGSPQVINQVDLYTSAGFEIQDYDIQVPSGSGWTTVASVRNNIAVHITTTLQPVTVSQLRINTLRGPENQVVFARINELEVTGCTPTPTTISGQVTGFARGPLPGIVVEAGGSTTITDARGNYAIQGLPFGSYTVHATGGGYTFGSPQFQIDHNTVSLSAAAPNAAMNLLGYNRNPIVYVHGWTDNPGRFIPRPSDDLETAGYAKFFAKLETSPTFTPPLETNVVHVIDAIADAKYQTGQAKVILFTHSMGGLVARAYLETSRYNNDVSQYFSFGSPHLGVSAVNILAAFPVLAGLVCADQPAVCEMSPIGMVLFNLTHWKRSGVDYHEIGGNAPLWTTKVLFCFKIFGSKHCLSIPWPDSTFRTTFGWIMGNLIAGPDDGLVGTCSAIGEPGASIDRFVTQELHTGDLGHRTYFDWDDGNLQSQQAYTNCVNNVLVTQTTSTCGVRSVVAWGCVLSAGLFPRAPLQASALTQALPAPPPGNADVRQRAVPQVGQILAGQTVTRQVIVEGGGTAFSVNVASGSTAFSVIDPNGQVIDPSYVASISGGSPTDPDAVLTSLVPNDAVTYNATAGNAQYYFPNARPGVWTVVVTGNADVPATGSPFSSDVMFDSSFLVGFRPGAAFVTPGTTASFSIDVPPGASSSATVSVALSDGTVLPLAVSDRDDGHLATLLVPSTSGYARVTWTVTGQRSDGVAFERGGTEDLQITSGELAWRTVVGDRTIARSNDPGLAQALVLDAQVDSAYTGAAEIAADLVDPSGAVVARVTQPATLATGSNTIALTFSGDDIYAAGRDGPYTLTNLFVMDSRQAPILAVSITNAFTTAAYRAIQFAPSREAPSVSTTGPYAMLAGDTLQLTANGIDAEGDDLSFAWDLDGDGSYETAGRIVPFTAPASSQPLSVTVGVQVTDPRGNTATAQTTIDIATNRAVNLAPQATVSASSTLFGYEASHANDDNLSTALDPSMSWTNDSEFVCDATQCHEQGLLPATLEFDLGATRTLDHVTLYTSESYPIQDYDLQVWDGAGWDLMDHVLGNTQLVRTSSFAPTTASKVRIVGYKGPVFDSIFVRVNELQVFGY